MRAFRLGRDLAARHAIHSGSDLGPALRSLELEVVPWRFRTRLCEAIFENAIAVDPSLTERWQRWLTAHAIGHHMLHTGTSLYLASWQWVNTARSERQAEEFAAGLLLPADAMAGAGESRLAARCGVPQEKARWALERFADAGADQARA